MHPPPSHTPTQRHLFLTWMREEVPLSSAVVEARRCSKSQRTRRLRTHAQTHARAVVRACEPRCFTGIFFHCDLRSCTAITRLFRGVSTDAISPRVRAPELRRRLSSDVVGRDVPSRFSGPAVHSSRAFVFGVDRSCYMAGERSGSFPAMLRSVI